MVTLQKVTFHPLLQHSHVVGTYKNIIDVLVVTKGIPDLVVGADVKIVRGHRCTLG